MKAEKGETGAPASFFGLRRVKSPFVSTKSRWADGFTTLLPSSFSLPAIALLCALVLLSGCATVPFLAPPRDALEDFVLEGRFSLRHEDKNHSGRLRWQHVGARDEVLLSSPFGQGMAEIVADPQGARLTMNDGKTYGAPDVESLTREVLAYPLPLGRLADWVRARAGSGTIERDAQGRLLCLRHEGWRIDYAYEDDNPQALPTRIIADRAGEFELRLRIEAWSAAGGAD